MERRDGGTIADAGPRRRADRALRWLRHGRRSARRRARARHRPPRHQAGQPAARRARRPSRSPTSASRASLDETSRFTQTGRGARHRRLPVARAGLGRARDRPPSDRYALAVVAYELLTGEKPFATGALRRRRPARTSRTPPPAAPGLPRDAQHVLERGLAKAPEDALADRTPPSSSALDAAVPREAAAPARPPPRVDGAAGPCPTRSRRRSSGRRTGTLLAALVGQRCIASPRRSRSRSADAAAATATDQPRGDHARTGAAGRRRSRAQEPERDAPSRRAQATVGADPRTDAGADRRGAGRPTRRSRRARTPRASSSSRPATTRARSRRSQAAVEACGDSTELDPCGYALYNLGAALNRAGRPDEAIPILEDRLERFGDNETKDVKTELKSARKNAR